jgi:hypothetical protein
MAGDNGGGEYMRRAANNRQGGLAGSSFGATLRSFVLFHLFFLFRMLPIIG